MTPLPTKKNPEAARQLRVLFDNTNAHAICMLDARGRIVSWNMSAQKLMGHTAEDVVGKNYSIFFSKEEIHRKVHLKALATTAKKGSAMAEGIRVRKDGTYFWARSFLTLVKTKNHESATYVLITHDITHEHMLEQKREEYIGITSHELKNPITTLSLYSELLAKRLELDRDKENLNMLRDMQSQTARLVNLVDELLTVSKVEGGTLELHSENFDIDAFIKKSIQNFQSITRTHTIVLQSRYRARVHADQERITQVLVNLFTNAVKYSPRASKIFVRVQGVKNKCVISVQDFGPGISSYDQRRIFTRYFRTNDAEVRGIAGVGLGLYISKEILKKHRQTLSVKSVVGKGSTFSFTLPLTPIV